MSRITRAALAIVSALALPFTIGVQPASAATAYLTGEHYICASDITVYNNGQVGMLYYADLFYIDHFGDGYNHAWGQGYHKTPLKWEPVAYGWVYNGWFC